MTSLNRVSGSSLEIKTKCLTSLKEDKKDSLIEVFLACLNENQILIQKIQNERTFLQDDKQSLARLAVEDFTSAITELRKTILESSKDHVDDTLLHAINDGLEALEICIQSLKTSQLKNEQRQNVLIEDAVAKVANMRVLYLALLTCHCKEVQTRNSLLTKRHQIRAIADIAQSSQSSISLYLHLLDLFTYS